MSLIVGGVMQPTPSQMAGGGGPISYPAYLTYQKVASGNPHTVRDAQTFLHAHGYNIGVDGIWGPQTDSALKAYLKGVRAAKFNAARMPAPKVSNKAGARSLVKNVRIGGGKGGGGKGGGGKGGRNAPAVNPGMPNVSGPFNPAKAAMAMANAQYSPAIQSLKGLLADVGNQGKYDLSQLHGWNNQMQNLMDAQIVGQQQVTNQGVQDVTNAIGNDAQLFGGQNAQAMQPAASNAAGYLQAVGQSQQDYLANMKPLLDAQAATSAGNMTDAVRAQQNNYQNQLTAQQQAKGAAYQADYQQALSDQATQEQNALALQQAQAMMPYQIGSAKAQLKADRANAAAAGPLNRAKLAATQAQINHYGALSKQEAAATKVDIAKAKAAGGKSAAILSPGSTTYDRVSGLLSKSLYTGNGKKPITNPIAAQASMWHAARAMGIINAQGKPLVPGALQMLNGMLQEQYARDAAWQANYAWNGRTFVKKG